MRRPRSRSVGKLPLSLSLLCLGLIAVIYEEFERPGIGPPANAAPPTDMRQMLVETPLTASFTMPPIGGLAEVLARPLFSATRRAPVEGKQGTTARAPFALVGLVLSADGHHALIEHGQPARLARVAEAQELEGWIIETILPD